MTSDEMRQKIEAVLREQPGPFFGASGPKGDPLTAGKTVITILRQIVEDDLKHVEAGGDGDVQD
jgi:hypothetical protein